MRTQESPSVARSSDIEWTDQHFAPARALFLALKTQGYDTFGPIAISGRIESDFAGRDFFAVLAASLTGGDREAEVV